MTSEISEIMKRTAGYRLDALIAALEDLKTRVEKLEIRYEMGTRRYANSERSGACSPARRPMRPLSMADGDDGREVAAYRSNTGTRHAGCDASDLECEHR